LLMGQTMKKAGVKFHMKAEINKLNPSSEGGSAVGSLSIKDKDDLPANLVIMGTGVAPATEFLKDSFTLEKDGGIKVDEYLRVEGQKNVYAIGDIAHYAQAPDGQQRRVEHWNVAGQQVSSLTVVTDVFALKYQGREAAHNICKPNAQVKYDKIPIFWSSVGKGLRYVGTGGGFDDSYTDGSIEELKVSGYRISRYIC
jgi:NADH dehydrogenase FAD-containing subunit